MKEENVFTVKLRATGNRMLLVEVPALNDAREAEVFRALYDEHLAGRCRLVCSESAAGEMEERLGVAWEQLDRRISIYEGEALDTAVRKRRE